MGVHYATNLRTQRKRHVNFLQYPPHILNSQPSANSRSDTPDCIYGRSAQQRHDEAINPKRNTCR